jgi:Tfp pilus assembly protein PilN
MFGKTALGIDISNERISLALLRRTKDGAELLKADSEPVPAGALDEGSVKDPALLAKVIKAMKNRHGIRTRRAVVSLYTHPILIHILELPDNLPQNIESYVEREVKHCAVLPRKNISFDYCGISALPHSAKKRVFVVATESPKVSSLISAISEAGLSVEAVEPPELACARAFYDGKIAKSLDSNVMIALLDDAGVAVTVFRNQSLDFIRRRNLEADLSAVADVCKSGDGLNRLAEEISAVIQYYDVEIGDASRSWRLVVVLRNKTLQAEEVANFLQTRFDNCHVEVTPVEGAWENIAVVKNHSSQSVSPSASSSLGSTPSRDGPPRLASIIAVGLAMKLLDVPQPQLKINLVPPESAEVKTVKQQALITANIALSILTVMIVVTGVLSASLNKTDEVITQMKEDNPSISAGNLLVEREKMDQKAQELTENIGKIKKIVGSGHVGDWGTILEDIRSSTPIQLWITSLVGDNSDKVTIKGQSSSYEAVQLFVEMLGKSKYIDSASIVEAEKDENLDGLVSYSINCVLSGIAGQASPASTRVERGEPSRPGFAGQASRREGT